MIPTEVLQEFRLFDGLDDSELAKVADISHERKHKPGAFCYYQNQEATDVQLCRHGQVDIILQLIEPWGTEVKVHATMDGEVFGWSAILGPGTYTTSAKCAVNVDEVYIKGSDLLDIFEQNLRIGYIVMMNLSAIMNSRLSEDRQRLTKEISPDFQL